MDPYWSNVVAAIPFTGDAGDTTATDVSVSGHTLTFAGDTVLAAAGHLRDARTSVAFDGTGDYINLGDSADFDLGSGDFCIEFWVQTTGTEHASAGMFAANWDGSTSNQSWKIEYSPALNAVYFWYSTTGSDTGTANFDFDTDGAAGGPTDLFDRNWHHIAIVRTGSTIAVHFDGVAGAGTDATNPTIYTNSGIDTLIGAERSGAGIVNAIGSCWIQDFRITKGASRYRAGTAFSPPKRLELGTATIDELFDEVIAIVKGNGADASTTFTDEGPLGLTCTSRNSAAVDTDFSKFGTGSIIITGSTQAIAIGAATNETPTDIENRDFTLEFWTRAAAEPTTGWFLCAGNATSAPDDVGYAFGWQATNNSWLFRYSEDAATDVDYEYDVDTDGGAIGPATMWDGTWRHIAVVRSNGTIIIFVDGVGKVVATANTANFWFSTVRPFCLGANPTETSASAGSSGYWMDDFRFTMAARYNGDFTPPTVTHPTSRRAAAPTDANWASVELLLEGETQRGSSTFTDSSDNAFTITNVGTWDGNMDTKLHGYGALEFTGSNLFTVPDSAELTFGSGDFTIEWWAFCPDTEPASTFTWLSKYDLLGAQEWWIRYSPSLNQFYFQYSTDGTTTTTITHDLSLSIGVDNLWNGEWHHFAITREGTAIHIHIDGDQSSSGTDPGANAIADTARVIAIGARYSGATPGEYIPAGVFIDGLRITRGVARYSSTDFTPQAEPWGLEAPGGGGGVGGTQLALSIGLMIGGD